MDLHKIFRRNYQPSTETDEQGNLISGVVIRGTAPTGIAGSAFSQEDETIELLTTKGIIRFPGVIMVSPVFDTDEEPIGFTDLSHLPLVTADPQGVLQHFISESED